MEMKFLDYLSSSVKQFMIKSDFNCMEREKLDRVFELFSNLFLLAVLMMNFVCLGFCFNFYNGLLGLFFAFILIWLIIYQLNFKFTNGIALKMGNNDRIQLIVLTWNTVAKQARNDFYFVAYCVKYLFFGNLTKSSINQKLNVSRGNNGGRNKEDDFKTAKSEPYVNDLGNCSERKRSGGYEPNNYHDLDESFDTAKIEPETSSESSCDESLNEMQDFAVLTSNNEICTTSSSCAKEIYQNKNYLLKDGVLITSAYLTSAGDSIQNYNLPIGFVPVLAVVVNDGKTTGMIHTARAGLTSLKEAERFFALGSENWRNSCFNAIQCAYEFCKRKLIPWTVKDDERFYFLYDPPDLERKGSSAGIPLLVAVLSKILNRKPANDICSTGRITDTGLMVRVGGLKEKVKAARAFGFTKIVLPKSMEEDFNKIKEKYRKGITPIYGTNFEDVFEHFFPPLPPT